MTEGTPEAVVAGYLEAANRHDLEGLLARLASGFELEFAGGPTLDRDQIAKAAGWDVGTEGTVRWSVVDRDGREVEVEGEETNAFLELLGLEPLAFRSRFTVDGDGRIARQTHRLEGPGPPLQEALEPVVTWARTHAADEIEELYGDGAIRYTEEQGRRWVALLRRWRQATEPDPNHPNDPNDPTPRRHDR